MTLIAQIVSVVLALGMLASGSLKLARTDRIVGLMSAVGVGGGLLAVLGILQIAGAIGLIAGVWFEPLGIAAAAGLVLYFAGAIGAHVRVQDPDWQPAGVLLAASATTLALCVAAG